MDLDSYVSCMQRLFSILIALAIAALHLHGATGADSPRPGNRRLQRVLAMYRNYRRDFPEVPELSVRRLRHLLRQERAIVLVDVRAAGEIQVSRIPGAISRKFFQKNIKKYRSHTIIAYCTIGARSGLWAQKMAQQGIRVHNLRGSILAWTHHRLPLVTPENRPTTNLHVYGKKWNLAAPGYRAVW